MVSSLKRESSSKINTVTKLIKACIRFSLIGVYLFFIFVVFIATIDLYKHGADRYIIAWYTGGIFVVLAVPFSVYEIFQQSFTF